MGLREPVKLTYTGEKFQECLCITASSFQLTWESPSLSMFSVFGASKLVFPCVETPEHCVFLPEVLSTRLWARVCWILTQAVSCYLLACYLPLGFPHSHCSAFFMCTSVWHMQGSWHENCNTFLLCRWCSQTASINSPNVCHETVMPPKPRLQQVTGLVSDVALQLKQRRPLLFQFYILHPEQPK